METTQITGRRTTSRDPEVEAGTTLINDWAARVLALWEQSRGDEPRSKCWGVQELIACYRLRDEIDSQVLRGPLKDATDAEKMLSVLRAADDLLIRFTTEARTAETLTAFDHYARYSEWWWKRVPRRGPLYEEITARVAC